MLCVLDQQMEKKEDSGLYFMDRIWVLLVGSVRTLIMDEAHATRYIFLYMNFPTTMVITLVFDVLHLRHYMEGNIKERLKAARDRQMSYAGNRRKPLEFSVGDQRIGPVAYRLRLHQELSSIHDTFHVSNLKKCLADANLYVPLKEIKVDKTLRFVEEPVEIID
ncbi:hypothetical protein Tco_0848502 [Tanacetum coccineum]